MRQALGATFLFAAAACNVAPTFELLTPAETTTDGGPAGDAGPLPDTGIPPDTGVRPEPLRKDGLACTRDTQCIGGKCMPDPAFPGGYCTKSGCRNDSQCSTPEDVCVTRAGPDICANTCAADSECREGYACFSPFDGEATVCLPASQRPPEKKADGEPCTRESQCEGNVCLPDPDWPSGHCTTHNCADFRECNGGAHGAVCVTGQEVADFCAWECAQPSDCRLGYTCSALMDGRKVCLPPFLVPPIGPPESYPFDMHCGLSGEGGPVQIDYEVKADTTSYTITVLTRDGVFLTPRGIILPSGGNIDFTGDHFFQLITTQLHGWIAPLTIPMVEQDAMLKETGWHRMVVDTVSSDVCWYLIEERAPGTKIDFDFYFVGAPNLSASLAPNDRGFQQMLTELDRILGQINLDVGNLRYHDVTGADEERFHVLGSEGDFTDLMARSIAPQSMVLDEHMSVNVFFVETITIGALGIASAIGGPPALHHTRASGVVSTSEFFNMTVPNPFTGEMVDGDLFTALIVGHEVGHYLNLWHTSDIDGTHDPVLDTAECGPEVQPDQCGAFRNIMYSAGVGTELTPGQGYSIGAHVLSKE